MKRIVAGFLILQLLLLAGCSEGGDTLGEETVPQTTQAVQAMAAETTVPATTVPEETVSEETQPVEELPPEEEWHYPTARVSNGREIYTFGMEMYNNTESALTAVSMQVVDSSEGEVLADKTYTGQQMEVYNGDRPAKYTMPPGYPLVLFMEEGKAAVAFDTRVVTVTLRSESGEETQHVFRFRVDEEQGKLSPDPEEAQWLPAPLFHTSRQFPCLVTNDTDEVLTLTGMYSLQYVGSNALRVSYRNAEDSYIQGIRTVLPGQTARWVDGIDDRNVFATHRKYVMYYVDPQGKEYKKVFRFKVDRENEPLNPPLVEYGLIPESSGAPEYTLEQLQEMVDAGLPLEEVAEKISTIVDLARYLQVKGYAQDQRGDLKFQYNGQQWHCNRSAQVVFADNSGNCGGGSNLANFILQGDYEKQGYIHYAGNRGGHVINYFYKDGLYYVLDLTTLFVCEPVHAVEDLSEFAEFYIVANHAEEGVYADTYVRLLYAYDRDGSSHAAVAGIPLTTVADEIQGEFQLLYQDGEAYAPLLIQGPPMENWPKDAQ